MFKRSFIRRKSFFFVDTNVIIGFQDDEANVRNFVRDPENRFFYTESVKNELQRTKNEIDSKFQFFDSGLNQSRKLNALNRLSTLWKDRFDGRKHQIRDGFGLSPEMLARFQYDLFIIFEASNSAFDVRLPDVQTFEAPSFLTNNMKLINKFMLRPETAGLLETTVNLSGFEHLIAVVSLENTIAEWITNRAQ
jgi:hypothetical protein